jgi:putative ABC transport system permease protein
MLGIIIGVAAVIVIVGLGNGLENYMTDAFQSMGTNLLTVTIMGRGSTRSVSVNDMYDILDKYPEYFAVMSPTVSVSGTVKVGAEQVDSTRISGVNEDYRSLSRYEMSGGRFIRYADCLTRSKACVVGSYIAKEFYDDTAVGERIKINGVFYDIVGTISERSDSTESSVDNSIFLAYSTAAKISNTGTIGSYSFEMVSEDLASQARGTLEDELYKVFRNSRAYNVMSMAEMLDTMTSMMNVMITILAVIAAISLLVGGIGIMNIMLVSVSERTREIGIRKALGAKRRHILQQFIIEAGTTSSLGGVTGIAVGYLVSMLATQMIVAMLGEKIVVAPTSYMVLMAFSISAGIGILFGYLPARKAARLNPIDALRYE